MHRRGFWRLDPLILKEEAFQACYRDLYEVWASLKPYFGSVVDWWESVKIRTLATDYRASSALAVRAELSGLQRALYHLVEAENRGEGMDLDGMEVVKGRLASYFRARADFCKCSLTCPIHTHGLSV